MTDLISRADVNRVLEDWFRTVFGADSFRKTGLCRELRELPSAQPSFPQRHENDCISREEAIKALGEEPEVWSGKDEYAQGLNNQWHYDVNALKAVPPTQPEQLERCPIYGGVCGYPSDQCYECPRHSGAQPEQLIRCGDCKYKDDGIDEDGFPFLKCLHGRSYGGTRINDFCSWAERKEGEAE